MHGTVEVNVVAPVKPGDERVDVAHWKLCVVAPQRSGAPNSSTSRSRVRRRRSRRAGSIWTCVRQRDRVDLAPVGLGDVQLRTAASASARRHRLDAEHREDRLAGDGDAAALTLMPPPAAQPVEELRHRVVDARRRRRCPPSWP